MSHNKKMHRFEDCGSNMGDGDRSDGHITNDVYKITCGACKQRILGLILKQDWSTLHLDTGSILSSYANQVADE